MLFNFKHTFLIWYTFKIFTYNYHLWWMINSLIKTITHLYEYIFITHMFFKMLMLYIILYILLLFHYEVIRSSQYKNYSSFSIICDVWRPSFLDKLSYFCLLIMTYNLRMFSLCIVHGTLIYLYDFIGFIV